MGLFSKSKEKADLKQTQEIKDISTQLPSLDNLTSPQTTSQDQNNFYNPFSGNQEPQTQATSQPFEQQPIEQTIPQQQTIQPQVQQVTNNNPPIDELISSQTMPQQQIETILNQQPQQQNIQQTEPIQQVQPTTEPQTQPEQNSIFNTQKQPEKSVLPSEQINTQVQPQINPGLEQKEELNKDKIQEMVDETIEQVIDERWQGLVEKIDKVAAWKEKQENHINLLKEDIVTMKNSFEKLEKRIIDKVSSYDKNILDVNSELKALEKVFQKITPTLVNNVNELSKIAKTFKSDSETEKIE